MTKPFEFDEAIEEMIREQCSVKIFGVNSVKLSVKITAYDGRWIFYEDRKGGEQMYINTLNVISIVRSIGNEQ